MNVIINDTGAVKALASHLSANAVQTDSIRGSIDYILNELAEYWEQTQQDAQAFAAGLRKDCDDLATIIECNKEFSETIVKYVETSETTGAQTTSNGGGN